jgi:maltooligosyltrehalose trehalohydrolase
VHVDYDEAERWLVVRRGRLRVVANLGPRSQPVPLDRPAAAVLAASAPGVTADRDVITVPATSITVIET